MGVRKRLFWKHSYSLDARMYTKSLAWCWFGRSIQIKPESFVCSCRLLPFQTRFLVVGKVKPQVCTYNMGSCSYDQYNIRGLHMDHEVTRFNICDKNLLCAKFSKTLCWNILLLESDSDNELGLYFSYCFPSALRLQSYRMASGCTTVSMPKQLCLVRPTYRPNENVRNQATSVGYCGFPNQAKWVLFARLSALL